MLSRWQLLRTEPGGIEHPDELSEKWCDAATIDAPAAVAVATVDHSVDTDDFDWWQRATVSLAAPTDIEFGGLTFPATVYLDGVPVAQCESMFLPVVIECGPGDHEIIICFASLNRWLATRRPRGRWRSTLVAEPGLRWARTTLIGRAPVYGDLPAPVGIWRPIRITPAALHTELSVHTNAASGTVAVTGNTAGERVRLRLYDPDNTPLFDTTTAPNAGSFDFQAAIGEPKLWWPNGYGPQQLYRAVIEVDGTDVADRQFGFRTLSVLDDSTGFRVSVNGTRIFCRGATWSPPDPVRLHVDAEQIRAQVRMLVQAGATMVRVVGGLVYEQDEFWQACAEAGLLVWQDAMLATFDPPAEHGDLVARELVSVLRAVSGNPALAVISGGSETLQQPEMLGLGPQESAMPVIDTLLPAAVGEHCDAHYVRASPAPPPGSADLAIRPDSGVAHWFGVGGYLRPVADVRSAGVVFAAECLAFANPPDPAFIDQHFGSPAVAGHHPDWKAGVPRDRGSSWDFEDVRDFYARNMFGEDLLTVRRTDPDRYLQLGRLAIAEAMHQCFAYWRRSDSGCGGALVLSGRDMCPGAGWGLLDSDGNAKAALTVLSRIWAPVSIVLTDDGLCGIRIDVYNDTPRAITGHLMLLATNSVGTAVDVTRNVHIPAASSVTFTDVALAEHFRDLSHAFRFGPPAADAVQATVRGVDGVSARDVLVINPRPGQSTSLINAGLTRHSDDRWELELASEVALRYLHVDVPGWTASDDLFHLAPRAPYRIMLHRNGSPAKPVGTLSSIDLVGTVALREARC